MSYDRQIDQVCQHTVYNEVVYLEPDRQTIKPKRAIASGTQVTLRMNGEIEVPPAGVGLPPSGAGSRPGPFVIQEGVNDTFRVRVDQAESFRTVTLPPSTQISTDLLVGALNDAQLGIYFTNDNNRVVFRGLTNGNSASLYVPADNTLATTLGILTNQEYRGRDLYPGWSLIVGPRSFEARPVRYIVFDRPLWNAGEMVTLSYSTLQPDCRRCAGTGVENDWRYTPTGDAIEARDEALLIQECLKMFYTAQGSNPFHPWYGTRLSEQIGRKLPNNGLVQTFIAQDIYGAFARWQSIKRQQETAVGQPVTDEEFPLRISDVAVSPSQQDPTVYLVSILIQNRSGGTVQIERGIRVPEPTDLLGQTQQQGLLRQSLQGYVLSG